MVTRSRLPAGFRCGSGMTPHYRYLQLSDQVENSLQDIKPIQDEDYLKKNTFWIACHRRNILENLERLKRFLVMHIEDKGQVAVRCLLFSDEIIYSFKRLKLLVLLTRIRGLGLGEFYSFAYYFVRRLHSSAEQ